MKYSLITFVILLNHHSDLILHREKLRPRERERIALSDIPKPGSTWGFLFLLLLLMIINWPALPSSRRECEFGHVSPIPLLLTSSPPPIGTNVPASPRTNVEVTIRGARILLAAERPAPCLLCTQRPPS